MKQESVPRNGLEVLNNLLGFGQEKMTDAIFVSIDFEGIHNVQQGFRDSHNSELGIACLDTRDLQLGDSLKRMEPSSYISTETFVTGSNSRMYKATKYSKFGVAQRISIYDLADKVRQRLIQQDPNTKEIRKVVIVRHFNNEMRAAEALRVRRGCQVPICQTLDISRIANELYKKPHNAGPLALKQLSYSVSLPFEDDDFHTAGNDANCTLRILLMLAVKSQEASSSCEGPQGELVNLLRRIALAPLSPQRFASDIQRLLVIQPSEPIDDLGVPVDSTKFFNRQKSMARWRLRRRHRVLPPEERARRDANKALRGNPANVERSMQHNENKAPNEAPKLKRIP